MEKLHFAALRLVRQVAAEFVEAFAKAIFRETLLFVSTR